jgi:hypothetical protein
VSGSQPQGSLLGALADVLINDGVQEDLGQQVMLVLRDADPHDRLRRLVDLRGTTHLADVPDRLVARAQQADLHQLVQVKRGELSGDPHTRGSLFAVDRLAGTADEPVQPATKWITERCHRSQR